MEIADGLCQLKIPMRYNPLGYTYSYLQIDDATLIDTGVGGGKARSALDVQLETVGLKTSDIERVIFTHLHRDHVGLAEYVRSISGSKIYAHEKALEVLKRRAINNIDGYDRALNELKALGGSHLIKLLSRFKDAFRHRPSPIPIDETVSDGDILKMKGTELMVIWTPGHATEHICLYDEKKRLLFSGDHILPRITSHISRHFSEETDPLSDYLSCLEKLRGLPVDLILPAHEHVFRGLDNRIDELILHHEARCREIKEALSEGDKTVFQISSQVSWDSSPWTRMPFWTKRMAAAETLAHLVHLRNIGEVEERLVKGVLHYRLA